MLIKALCDYADLRERGRKEKEIPEGWCEQNVHFQINLSPEGKIVSIADVREKRTALLKNGKESVILEPIKVILPKRKSISAPCSEIIEHRAKYIFGFTFNNKSGNFELADKFHNAFVKHELDFFSDLDSEICCAYKNFISRWNPADETENPELQKLGKKYNEFYFRFALTGGRGFLEEDEQFIAKYTRSLAKEKGDLYSGDAVIGTCGILGERLPISDCHDKITKGLLNGRRIVCMKENAFHSYGKEKSYNGNISVQAMEKYTLTLNKLLDDSCHSVSIDNMVIVFFAMKEDDTQECDMMWSFLSDSPSAGDTERFMQSMFGKAQGGAVGDTAYEIDRSVTFYIAGLTAPDKGRICQKFLYRNTFGAVIDNLSQHQRDLRINPENGKEIYFYRIKNALIPSKPKSDKSKEPKVTPKSNSEKVPPPLMASILLSALNGTDYPNALLETVVRRVKTDRYIKLNDTRAGIIKACINRKLRRAGKKEEITMALNTENKNPAYLCGRLFAVYEKIQQDASGDLNRTIKDSYFSSVCSRPSAIMPKLSQLAQNHMRKLGKSSEIFYSNLIGEIMDGFEGTFPQTLDLDSQGKFIVGYYQQNKALYTPRKQNND